ncbi:helix-turn-helix transcriptional regulator [Kordiimonas aquimaris]|uniref:helix-turn-helix transcriptional regulator n=1 Tax=Kordiimonas aquimaris TaxID=707591 RepID=UPI0021CE772C|nr:LuxR family transcriptional regulator [Kordiimonas aquimaris]
MQLLKLLDEQSTNWIMSVINQRLDRNSDALGTNSFIDESLHHIVNNAYIPTLLISSNHQLLFSNKAAMKTLQYQTDLYLEKGYLRGTSAEYDKLFKQKIRKICKANAASTKPHQTLMLNRANDERGIFASIESIQLLDGKSAIAALFFQDPANLPNINTERLRGWYGLSKREAALATAFAQGMSLKDYAHTHGVSITTVRTQFAQVKTKMSAASQADVVRLTLLAQD